MTQIEGLTPSRTYEDSSARDWFWTIVNSSMDMVDASQLAKLRAALDTLSDEDLVTFIGLYRGVHGALYLRRLWAAAYLMNGGCSDDGFMDFRAWLISRGRTVAEGAAADPDSLADLGVEPDAAMFEVFGYVMLDAFRARSGGIYPTFGSGAVPHDADEADWQFDFDDEAQMRHRLPRLATLYL